MPEWRGSLDFGTISGGMFTAILNPGTTFSCVDVLQGLWRRQSGMASGCGLGDLRRHLLSMALWLKADCWPLGSVEKSGQNFMGGSGG